MYVILMSYVQLTSLQYASPNCDNMALEYSLLLEEIGLM